VLSDCLPTGRGDPQMRKFCLSHADGIPLDNRQAGANQVLQHFKIEAARRHSGQRVTTGDAISICRTAR
jgi:hypothetical protein